MRPISDGGAWRALQRHRDSVAAHHLRDPFEADPQRFERFNRQACGILLDFSKTRITERTVSLLLELAAEPSDDAAVSGHDASTKGLMNHAKRLRVDTPATRGR